MSTIERKEVEDYLSAHALEGAINDVVNEIVKDKPVDPYVVMADLMKQRSKAQQGILSVQAMELMDGRGIPAMEVSITTSKGVYSAMACSKLVGVNKAVDPPECRRDGVMERFGGMGVTQVCDHINGAVAAALVGKDPREQAVLDELIVAAVTPANDEEPPFGSDAALAVSMAVCRAGAAEAELPLHEHIAVLAGNSADNTSVPVPMFNIINGGLHCGGGANAIQELMVMPVGAESIGEAMELGYGVQALVRDKLAGMSATNLNTGAAGGFAPVLSAEEALEAVSELLVEEGLDAKVKLCIDMAASQLRVVPGAQEAAAAEGDEEGKDGEEEEDEGEGEGEAEDEEEDGEEEEDEAEGDEDEEDVASYDFAKFSAQAGSGDGLGGAGAGVGAVKDSDDMIDMYKEWVSKYPLISIEDPFDRKDWDSFFRLKSALEERGGEGGGDDEVGEGEDEADGEGDDTEAGDAAAQPLPPVGGDDTCVFQIVGDELLVGAEEIMKARDENQVNTMTLELGKRPTVSQNIAVCSQVQDQGWGVIVSSRPGEATDCFMADFAVGMQAGQIKAGGLQRAENTSKYNQLLRIASMPSAPPYAGPDFRRQDGVS